jgi:hypothetical protein
VGISIDSDLSFPDAVLDIDAEAVPPLWPPTPDSLAVREPVYDVMLVPLTSILLVTNRTVKVILYPFPKSALTKSQN